MSSSLPNIELPFFAYGIFRPGEISFLGIKDYVDCVEEKSVKGNLILRDGITLLCPTDRSNELVKGYTFTFKDKKAAYDFIKSLEPDNYYQWGIDDKENCNCLYSRYIKRNQGNSLLEANWKTCWDDPFFRDAFEVLEEYEYNNDKKEPIGSLKQLFRLQMKYMLLWTIIERFTFLRYGFGVKDENSISKRNAKLAQNEYFKTALKDILENKNDREIFDAKEPTKQVKLSKEDPPSSIEYYYQLRCNITHRGKAVTSETKRIEDAYNELKYIIGNVLDNTEDECKKIKAEYERI